jgi:hypothetical protein
VCFGAGTAYLLDGRLKIAPKRPPQPFVRKPAPCSEHHLNGVAVGGRLSGRLNCAGGVAKPDRKTIVADACPKGIQHARRGRGKCRRAGGRDNVGCVPHGSFLWPEGVGLRQ